MEKIKDGFPPPEDILYGFLKMRQPVIGPRVNMDTVLLAGFARVQARDRVMELGCAHGGISLILAKRCSGAAFTGIDIQNELIELARKNASENGLEERTDFKCRDLREVRQSFTHQSFDVVVVNPPYEDPGRGRRSDHETNRLARQGEECSFEDVAEAARFLLKNKGRLFMVMRALRLAETMSLLRASKIEPRTLLMVHPTPKKCASVFLLEAVRDGGPALSVLPPLYIYGDNGHYTERLLEFYAPEVPPVGNGR